MMMCCRSDNCVEIEQPVTEAIKAILELKDTSSVQSIYTPILEIASIACLLNIPGEVFKDLKVLVARDTQ